ncbi:MAG: hypothetical protein ACLQU5_02335 [Isosphaeraceae bacterium]
MKPVHLSVVALIAAIAGIGTAVATQDSLALSTATLALITAFLPAIGLLFPWFEPPAPKPS